MINWRPFPFIRLLIPFLLGIGLYLLLGVPLSINGGLLAMGWIFLLVIHQSKVTYGWRWLFGVLLNILLLLLGYERANQFHGAEARNTLFVHHHSSTHFTGTVVGEPVYKDRLSRYQLAINAGRDTLGNWKPSGGYVLLTIFESKDSLAFNSGDLLVFKNQLTPVAPPANPKAFDYRRYLFFKNIHFQCILSGEKVRLLASGSKHSFLSNLSIFRKRLLKILESALSEKEELAVAKALILGDKSGIETELRDAYAQTGAMHVLAVSGLHVGLIFLIFRGFFSHTKRLLASLRHLEPIVCIFAIWSFALLTGGSPSVLRASTMFSFVIIGISVNRSSSIYNTLAASCFCLLWINPFLIGQVGFQLSYSAIVGIVYFQPKLYNLWLPDSRILDSLWQLITVSFAAQLTTFPLSLYYFHQFPLYFWLSGIIVVPAATVILSGGLILFVLTSLSPYLSTYVAILFEGFLWIVNQLIYWIQALPSGLISGVWIAWPTTVLVYVSIGFLMTSIETNRYYYKFLCLLTLLIAISWTSVNKCIQLSRPEIVSYDIPRHQLVDFFWGREVVNFRSNDLSKKKIQFAAENYRMYKGVRDIDAILTSQTAFQNDFLKREGEWLQFGNTLFKIDTTDFKLTAMGRKERGNETRE